MTVPAVVPLLTQYTLAVSTATPCGDGCPVASTTGVPPPVGTWLTVPAARSVQYTLLASTATPQGLLPLASVARQRPAAQTTVDGAAMVQALPQAPQLFLSAVTSVHAPEQQTWAPHAVPSGWFWTPQTPPVHVATMHGEPVGGHVDGSEQVAPPELATALLDVLDVTLPPADAVLDVAAPPVAALDAVDVAAPPVDAALAGLPLVDDAPAPDAACPCPPPLPEVPVTSYEGRAHAPARPAQARNEETSREARRAGMALRGRAWGRPTAAAVMTTPYSGPVKAPAPGATRRSQGPAGPRA